MYVSTYLSHRSLCWCLEQEGLNSDHEWFTRGGGGENPWDTHICQTHSDSPPSLGLYRCLSAQSPYTQSPFCRGMRRKNERRRYEGLTRGGRKMLIFYFFVSSTGASPVSRQIYLCLSMCFCISLSCVCVYSLYSVLIQYFTLCIYAKSAPTRTLHHWMSQHVAYSSCCWSNNRALPSESQCASLAAAISALVPLLITSVDQLCAIS